MALAPVVYGTAISAVWFDEWPMVPSWWVPAPAALSEAACARIALAGVADRAVLVPRATRPHSASERYPPRHVRRAPEPGHVAGFVRRAPRRRG